MLYPAEILPQPHFKKINESLDGFFICRKVPNRQALELTPIIKEELLGLERASDCFDYSTNLPGVFELVHNKLEIVGEDKKYFITYWDEGVPVVTPIHEQDLIVNDGAGWFFLPINKVAGLRIPFNRKQNLPTNETALSAVVHTPSNSNFWHFSIKWKDDNGDYISANESKWKNQIIAKVRALFSELINFADVPNQVIRDEWYTRS